MCIYKEQQERTQIFCGTIKSFNVRRGFGFVSCEEAALRFGRDVYLSKEEALILLEDAAGANAQIDSVNDKKIAPVQEGDVLLFQVKLSVEGFPQAVQPQKMRRLRGVIHQVPSSEAAGIICVNGEADNKVASGKAAAKDLIGAEVRLPFFESGQLKLLPGDEVAFCCKDEVRADGDMLQAQLLELLSTCRAADSVLGFFCLSLPRFTREGLQHHVDDGASHDNPLQDALPTVDMRGYALLDTIFLSDIPLDVTGADLMRLFGKVGAKEVVVTPSSSSMGFAYIDVGGSENVAKFLVQATHTVTESGVALLARVSSCAQPDEELLRSSLTISYDVAPVSHSDFAVMAEQSLLPGQRWADIDVRQSSPKACHTSSLLSEQAPCGPVNVLDAAPQAPLQTYIQQVPVQQPLLAVPAPMLQATRCSWRCCHGNITVAPMEPEMAASSQYACGMCIKWPTVVHASVYVVELVNKDSVAYQRFVHPQPSNGTVPHMTELVVDGLPSGTYSSCVRSVAPCGCESAPSPWSSIFLGFGGAMSFAPISQPPQDVPTIVATSPPVLPAVPAVSATLPSSTAASVSASESAEKACENEPILTLD